MQMDDFAPVSGAVPPEFLGKNSGSGVSWCPVARLFIRGPHKFQGRSKIREQRV